MVFSAVYVGWLLIAVLGEERYDMAAMPMLVFNIDTFDFGMM